MKIKILKILFTSLFFLAAFVFFINTVAKTKAADPVTVCGNAYISIISVSPRRVVPGNNVTLTVRNNCAGSSASINVYIYPSGQSINDYSKYRKETNEIIPASNQQSFDIPIYGTDIGPNGEGGQYTIEVYGRERKGAISSGDVITVKDEITVTSYGMVISGSDSVKQGDTGNYKIKFFGHGGNKFSLYVDNDNGLKLSDTLISSTTYTYDYVWDTARTELGSHQIIVKINGTSLEEKFEVKVTAKDGSGTEGGGGGNTFSLSNLNSFNIKNLLKACPAEQDLAGITCIVDKVIAWLLDIGAVISFIMILYASIIYLTSYGEESKAELAKKTLIWSVIGVIVIGAAMAIMRIISNYLS